MSEASITLTACKTTGNLDNVVVFPLATYFMKPDYILYKLNNEYLFCKWFEFEIVFHDYSRPIKSDMCLTRKALVKD